MATDLRSLDVCDPRVDAAGPLLAGPKGWPEYSEWSPGIDGKGAVEAKAFGSAASSAVMEIGLTMWTEKPAA